jgi:hypothetical protein
MHEYDNFFRTFPKMKSTILINYLKTNIARPTRLGLIIGSIGLLVGLGASQAAPFSSGTVVVLRLTDGSGLLTNRTAEVFLDEYTSDGDFVQTIPIPSSGANALTVSGFSISEAALTRSPNGRWLALAGYNTSPGYLNAPASTSAQVPRIIGVVDASGAFSAISTNLAFYSGNNMRGAVSDGTNSFWGFGAISATGVGGLNYYGFEGSAGVVYSTNLRVVNIINGSLYFSAGSGNGISKFNGRPTTAATPVTEIPTGAGSSPYGFAINASGTIAYVADDRTSAGGGVQRWNSSGGGWSLAYTLGTDMANTGTRGIAVDWSAASPVIYATTSENTFFGNPANRLVRIVDVGPGSSTTTLAVTGGSSSFRGIAFAPLSMPSISIQPMSQAFINGKAATLSVSGNGYGTLSYQWYFQGLPVAGATNQSLSLTNVSSNHAGNYYVTVANSVGAVTSSNAALTVYYLATQPTNVTTSPGDTVELPVVAAGGGPFSYQWRLNGANIPGATGSSLLISNAQPADGGTYSVVVQTPVGTLTSTDAIVKITSHELPFADNFADRSGTNSFNGVGSGTNTAATFESLEPRHPDGDGGHSVWLEWTAPSNGVATFSTRGSSFDTLLAVYTGITLTNLTLVTADDDGGGYFTSSATFPVTVGVTYIIAIDGFSGLSGNVVLSWNLITNVATVPIIVQQPADKSVQLGGSTTFNVLAAAGTNIFYQWYFNLSQPLAGATNTNLTITNADSDKVGVYRVVVTSADGQSVTSRVATLEIGSDSPSSDKLPHALLATIGFPSVSVGSIGLQLINNFNSTTEQGEPTHSDAVGGSSRWYLLTALDDATFLIDTIGSDIDTLLSVYTGTNIFLLTPVTSDNNGAPDGIRSVVRFPAVKYTTYLIRVDGVNNAQGRININWTLGIPPPTAGPPMNQILVPGGSLLLQVVATNAVPSPSYQWVRNGNKISGATNSTLSLANVQYNNIGDYSVVLNNALGVVTNHIALVTMQSPLKLIWNSSGGTPLLQVVGSSTQAVILQVSTNLSSWTPVHTNPTPLLPISFLDTNFMARPGGFYRFRSWP